MLRFWSVARITGLLLWYEFASTIDLKMHDPPASSTDRPASVGSGFHLINQLGDNDPTSLSPKPFKPLNPQTPKPPNP